MKIINLFRLPTAREYAQRELAEAQRALLVARSHQELANGLVIYRSNQTARLEKFLETA